MNNTNPVVTNFVNKVAQEARSGRAVQILTDFDGTIAPLTGDPGNTKVDKDALAALKDLAKLSNVTITIITGRTIADVREKLGIGVNEKPPFTIIGSHGTEIQRENQMEIKKIPFPPGGDTLTQKFNDAAAELQKWNAGLTVQYKHGGVNVDVRTMIDKNPTRRKHVVDAARRAFEKILAAPEHPKINGKPVFSLHETADEVEIRSDIFDKAYAIEQSKHIQRKVMTMFLGDSFGPKGNDRTAADLVGDKKEFSQGLVVQVRNGRDPVNTKISHRGAPDLVMDNPAQTGELLSKIMARYRELPAPYPGWGGWHGIP